MKVCRKCGVERELTEYTRHPGTKDKLQPICKPCDRERTKQRWHTRKTNPIYKVNEQKRLAVEYDRLKTQVFAAYGGFSCICCGENNEVFLAIDHINNNGAEHRKNIPGGNLYRWLRKSNYPPGFQVLCHNCNWAKSHGGCPHKAAKQSSGEIVDPFCLPRQE